LSKPKVAIVALGVCSGCEITIVDTDEAFLDILNAIDLCHLQIAADFKYEDIPEELDIAIISGNIRNEENMHIAKMLEERAKIIVANGSCACFGGIPGLGNLWRSEDLMKYAYMESPTTENPDGILPDPEVLTLTKRVYALPEVIRVDYMIPGCPPQPHTFVEVITALLEGREPQLPNYNVCEECKRKRSAKKMPTIRRWTEGVEDDGETCLIEQGFLCYGPATRAGCGAICVNEGNAPCIGCYGPTDQVVDQGAKMIGAIGAMADVAAQEGEADDPEEFAKKFVDPVGWLYRFTLPASLIKERINK